MSITYKIKAYFDSLSSEQIEELKNKFAPKRTIPKGWVSIEDHLPMMLAEDFMTGTQYKIKFIDGSEGITTVGDHNVWYYFAKENNITHWWND